MGSDGTRVFGQTTDAATRCVHYRTVLDIVAIKFRCCGRYYPCFQCHAEGETHPARQWPEADWAEKAILCGECHTELSILAYRQTTSCPACGAAFNERCGLHAHLYFEVAVPVTEPVAEPGDVPPVGIPA